MTETGPDSAAFSQDRAAQVADVFKPLANPVRLRLLTLLQGSPQSVGELVAATGLTQSQVSMTLSRLRGDGMLSCTRSEKDSRIMVYAIADARLHTLLDMARRL